MNRVSNVDAESRWPDECGADGCMDETEWDVVVIARACMIRDLSLACIE